MQICGVTKCGNTSPNGFFKIHMLNGDYNTPDFQLAANRQRDWLNVMNIRLQIVQNPELYNLFERRLYVCPKHFVSGQPAPLHDLDNVDWVPTINLPMLDTGEQSADINDKNYKCNYCPQWYKSQNGVLRHMSTHSAAEKKDWQEREGFPGPTMESHKSTLNKINGKMSLFDWCTCAKCTDIVKQLEEHLIAQHSDTDRDRCDADALSDHAYISPKKETTTTTIQQDDVDVGYPPVVKRKCFKVLKVGEKKLFACQFCEIQLENRDVMFAHFKSHLAVAGRDQSCSPTVKESKMTQLDIKQEDEEMDEEQEEFQCAVCATVDSSQQEILNCVRQHVHSGWPKNNNSGLVWEMAGTKADLADDNNKPYIPYDHIHFRCTTCQRYFDEMEAFQKHSLIDHDQSLAIAVDNIVRVTPVIKCLKCALDNGDFLTFLDIGAAMQHRKQHHFHVNNTAQQPVKRVVVNTDESEQPWTEEVVYYAKNPITESFQCPCQRLYEFKSSALKCLAQHVGIRRFKCREDHVKFQGKKCQISFFSVDDLAQHKEKFHRFGSEDPAGVCHVCGNVCKRQNLAAHIRQAHRKYQCTQCTKSFENNFKLSAHIAGVHKRIKKYRCSECNKHFVWKSGALACQARHHKGYRCEYCDEVFVKLYEKIGHVADNHPMFGGSGGGSDALMGIDFNTQDLGGFEF